MGQHRRTSFWITRRTQVAQVREACQFGFVGNLADILSHATAGDHEPCLLVAAYPILRRDFLPDRAGPDSAFLPGPCALNCNLERQATFPNLPILPRDFIQWQNGEFSSSGEACSMDAVKCECSHFIPTVHLSLGSRSPPLNLTWSEQIQG